VYVKEWKGLVGKAVAAASALPMAMPPVLEAQCAGLPLCANETSSVGGALGGLVGSGMGIDGVLLSSQSEGEPCYSPRDGKLGVLSAMKSVLSDNQLSGGVAALLAAERAHSSSASKVLCTDSEEEIKKWVEAQGVSGPATLVDSEASAASTIEEVSRLGEFEAVCHPESQQPDFYCHLGEGVVVKAVNALGETLHLTCHPTSAPPGQELGSMFIVGPLDQAMKLVSTDIKSLSSRGPTVGYLCHALREGATVWLAPTA